VLFMIVYYILDAIIGFEFLQQAVNPLTIAIIHTVFKAFSTLATESLYAFSLAAFSSISQIISRRFISMTSLVGRPATLRKKSQPVTVSMTTVKIKI